MTANRQTDVDDNDDDNDDTDDDNFDDDEYEGEDATREVNNTENVLRAQVADLALENIKLKYENEKLSCKKL